MSNLPFGWITAAGLFFALMAVLALIAASWIVIRLRFVRENDNDHFELKITALRGLLRYRLKIPVFQLNGLSVKIKKEEMKEKMGAPAENVSPDEIDKNALNGLNERYKHLLEETRNLTGWVRSTLSRIRLSDWRWETSLGTGDAYWTAMATGFAWSAQTTVIGVLSQLVRLTDTPKMTVVPIYDDRMHFSTQWSCIAKIRFGYAFAAGLRLFFRRKHMKNSLQSFRSILSKS
jgi:hypothetical protein